MSCVFANSDDRKVPKLRSTIKDPDQVKTSSSGSYKIHTKPPNPISTNVSLKGLASSRVLAHHQPCHEKHHSTPPKTSAGHRNPRAGVSFCFSRRAQLKLDSCASVFSDGLEEASDSVELQRHRQRLALEALWSCSSSPRTPCNDDRDPSHDPPALGWADGAQMEAQAEHLESQAFCSTTEPEKLMCPDTRGPGSNGEPAGSEDRLVDRGQRPRAEGAYGGSEERECPSPGVYTDGQGTVTQSHKDSLQHTEKNTEQGIMQNGRGRVPESIHPLCEDENPDWSSKVSFLNVLSKDGNTLKWPSELVQYTSDEPHVSYSCNPLCCFFEHREGKEKSTKPVEMEFERLAGHGDRAESRTRNVPGDKLGILKPKRPKHKRKGKTRRRKLDAVRSRQALKTCSQTEAGGRFEFQSAPADTSQHKQARAESRHKLRKRRRSVRDETSNESDTPEHSLKSIIVSSLSAPARKRKKCQTVRRLVSALRLVRGRPFPCSLHYATERGDNYRWYDDTSKCYAASTPNSDKSGSWSGLSDMTSDGEWPAYHPGRRSTSPRSKPWRKEHGRLKSCVGNSSQNISYHRHISDSPCRDLRDFERAGDCWDYTDLCIYDKRKYSAVCNNPDQNEKYNIRRHKRFFEGHRNKEHRIQDNSRLFYRVYDSPEPHDDIRDWWSESPVSRRHREREEYSWSSPERSQDRWYNKPASIRSPSLSSSTSVSDLSGEWMHHSSVRPSPSRQSQKHNHSAERLVKTSHSPLRKETHSPSNIAEPNSSKSNSGQDDITQKSTDHCTLVDKEVKVKKANSALLLPLIGKLPSIKRGAKKMGINKDASTGNQTSTTVPSNPQVQASLQQNSKAETLKPDSSASHDTRDQDKAETAGIHCARCTTPPLSEQPITFTEEEMEKYRLLQLQAQQHMQQQHLQEQHEIQQTSVDMSHIPTPEPSNQNTPYGMLQPSPSSPVTLLPLHPSHFSPPLPAAFFPAPPATVLAAHPLHLIPGLHPVHPHHHIRGLALRPLPPAALLPAMFGPIPMASTLQIHPLLHPLFRSQDLQRPTS